MKAISQDEFVLSTGRKFYANCGLIGAVRTKHGLEVAEGYDGGVSGVFDEWTAAERRELADYMIGLWQEIGYPCLIYIGEREDYHVWEAFCAKGLSHGQYFTRHEGRTAAEEWYAGVLQPDPVRVPCECQLEGQHD